MTEPWWHHNGTCRLLAKECARWARASLLSLCWASSWRHLVLQLQLRYLCVPECKRLLLSIELPFYTCTHNNMPGISRLSSVNAQHHAVYFRKSGNLCGALLRRNKSFCLPSYDTPCSMCCNKAKFHVHRRHAARGACEQKMTAL